MLFLRDEVWGVQTLGKQQLCATLYTTECYKDLCCEGRAHQDQDRFQPALMGEFLYPPWASGNQEVPVLVFRTSRRAAGEQVSHTQKTCFTQPFQVGTTHGP